MAAQPDISFHAAHRSASFHQHLYFIFSSLVSLGFSQFGLWYKNKPEITSLFHAVESCRPQTHAKHKIWFIHRYVIYIQFPKTCTPTSPDCHLIVFMALVVKNRWLRRLFSWWDMNAEVVVLHLSPITFNRPAWGVCYISSLLIDVCIITPELFKKFWTWKWLSCVLIAAELAEIAKRL